jgi:hypothetical protein
MRGLRKDWLVALRSPKDGDLKVWWIPQVPMKSFEAPVPDLLTARYLLDTLAEYDFFQLENRIKPDFSNAGGLMIFEDGEWCDYYDERSGDEFEDLTIVQLTRLDRERAEKAEVAVRAAHSISNSIKRQE